MAKSAYEIREAKADVRNILIGLGCLVLWAIWYHLLIPSVIADKKATDDPEATAFFVSLVMMGISVALMALFCWIVERIKTAFFEEEKK